MTWTFCITIALLVGYAADLVFGEHFTPICPAVLLGKLIAALEPPLRSRAGKDPARLRIAGRLMVLCVCAAAFIPTLALSVATWFIQPALFCALQAFWFYQTMATRCLADASIPVYQALQANDLPEARTQVGYLVGRDTQALSADGVAKAAVETIAENTSDGSIAPLFWFALGGAPLAMLYKAINTMDSMLGYKNEKYLHFGRCAALLDDAANYLPARITAFSLIVAAFIVPGCSPAGAFRIWRRDRAKSTSPNSGQCETAVAGALGVQLLGPAYYFGQLADKPAIGDATRSVVPADILTSHKLMYVAATLACLVAVAARVALLSIGMEALC